jgi:hypothetical protein
MGTLEDIRKWLKEIPLWKELDTIPARTAALEKRVTELEDKLNGKWPPDVCRLCGERAARIGNTVLDKTTEISRWDCTACNNSDFRYSKVT